MNRKTSIAAASVVSTLVLGLLTNLVSAEPTLVAWSREHPSLVLVAAVFLTLTAIVAQASDAVDQADRVGDPLSGASLAGQLVGAAVAWGVGGALLGWVVEGWFWPRLVESRRLGVTGSTFLLQVGPGQASCALIGFLAGDRLKFADHAHAGLLSWTGGIAGAIMGLVSAPYFAAARPLELAPSVVVGVPALAAATVGAGIAAFTAAFKPRYERQERREKQLRADRHDRKREREASDLELYERTMTRLRRMGHSVPAVDTHEPQPEMEHDVTRMFIQALLDEPVGPDKGPPHPPYVVIDEQGREFRFASLKALAGYADDVAADRTQQSIDR